VRLKNIGRMVKQWPSPIGLVVFIELLKMGLV